MIIETKDLIGPALDWAVARIEMSQDLSEDIAVWVTPLTCDEPDDRRYQPSSDWAQGGPIIEREVIVLIHPKWDCWTAQGQDSTDLDMPVYEVDGPTALIAAMRCYVLTKLGEEVDVPEELL